MTEGLRPKRIYMAIRRPGLTREQFAPRWRQHGTLAMSLPRWTNVARYGHCDVVPCDDPAVGASDEYDGIGLIWFRSPETRRGHFADAGARTMGRDEEEVFGVAIKNADLFAAERLLRDGPSGGVKKVSFLTRKAGMSREDFLRHWRDDHAPLLLETPGLREPILRYAQNDPLPPDRPGETRWPLDYDGVEEVWYADLAALRAAHAHPAFRAVREDRARFVGDALVMLTNELILHDVDAGIDGTQSASR
ncbi:MAG: EthD family reductase [Alphaproteobacteria bacterium]